MTKKQRAQEACRCLAAVYPEATCSLVYQKPYELMIAARLSAQCTDARVNIVTRDLFVKYPTLEAFASADYTELCEDIHACGFFKTKAASIIGMAQRILTVYGGQLPDTMEELLTLPGIGRKTANLIMGDIYGKPAIVTDTHFIRITGRLGLTKNTQPKKVEEDLIRLIPPKLSSDFCHRIFQFGRDTCRARNPACPGCPLGHICAEKSGFERNMEKRAEKKR